MIAALKMATSATVVARLFMATGLFLARDRGFVSSCVGRDRARVRQSVSASSNRACNPAASTLDAADDLERDQPVGGRPQLQHVLLGLGVPSGGEQAGQDVADGLPFVPGVGGRYPHSAQAVHELV